MLKAKTIHRRMRACIAATLAAGMALSGCQTVSGARNEYINAADSCSGYREPLVKTQEYFSENLVAGGVGGALLGAVAGALLSKNRAKGALIGAGVGALVGVSGAYLKSKMDQAKDRAELRAAINKDAEADAQRLNRFSTSLNQLNQCRADQLQDIKSAYRSRGIDRAVAERRLDEVRAFMAKDAKLVGEVLEDSGERTAVYAESAAKVDNVQEDIVLADAKRYEPIVNRKPKSEAVLVLPTVNKTRRPAAQNSIQKAAIVRKDVKAEFDSQQAALDDEAADILTA